MISTPRLLVVALFATGCVTEEPGSPADQTEDTDSGTSAPTDTDTTDECEDEDVDCAGACFGSATVDDCGVCDEDPANDCVATATATGGWICPIGISCQDVWEISVVAGSEVAIEVDQLLGDSVVRLAVFPPGVGLDGDNLLVGASRDLSCSGPDQNAGATFYADVTGTYTLAVGRDALSSTGAGGSYALQVAAASGLELTGPVSDDQPTLAPPAPRCGSEYVFDGRWTCDVSWNCQDTYEVEVPAGLALELAALGVTDDSVPRFALHAPGVELGGLNLLTNNTNDRRCVGQNEDDAPIPYVLAEAGRYTVALSRDWATSAGTYGDYRLVVAGDGFFDRPVALLDDSDSLAPSSQCDWRFTSSGSWSCETDQSCQDVFDLALPAGSRFSAEVTGVTGGSVVRLAAFGPGEPLAGTNLLTGANQDFVCGNVDGRGSFEPVEVPAAGVHRIAVGRDAENSLGSSGTYEVVIGVENGYPSVAPSVDDEASEAAGTVCANSD